MGNVQPYELSSANSPSRPFDASKKKSCLVNGMLPALPEKKSTTLHQLILMQDWQRVLIRTKLYPHELKQYTKLSISADHFIKVLPLHLACALDPPSQVVDLLLEHYVDAASLSIQSVCTDKNMNGRLKVVKVKPRDPKKKQGLNHGWNRTKPFVQKFHEWRKSRKGAYPVDETMLEYDDCQCFLRDGCLSEQEDDFTIFRNELEEQKAKDIVKFVQTDTQCSHQQQSYSNAFMETSSLSTGPSLDGLVDANGNQIILQLGPSGDVCPLSIKLNDTEETTSDTSSYSMSRLFRVSWDFESLLEQVVQNGMLLPLHLACLYSASSDVLRSLVNAHATSCLVSVSGMLPIHWVSAGWYIPPLLPSPTNKLPLLDNSLGNKTTVDPLDRLHILRSALPDTVKVKSGNHGMTAEEYVVECMEDSDYKDACIHYLRQEDAAYPDHVLQFDECSFDSMDSLIFSSETSNKVNGLLNTRPCVNSSNAYCNLSSCLISTMIEENEWENVIRAVEDDPVVASKWVYGMDGYTLSSSPVVWKRLPLHLACIYGAPLGVVLLLLQSYPSGAYMVCPHDGSLALHVACSQQHITTDVVKALLRTYPAAIDCSNKDGQLPLHIAVASKASYEILEILMEANRQALSIQDLFGKTPMDYAKTNEERRMKTEFDD